MSSLGWGSRRGGNNPLACADARRTTAIALPQSTCTSGMSEAWFGFARIFLIFHAIHGPVVHCMYTVEDAVEDTRGGSGLNLGDSAARS
jgi:hypothetical protein